MNDASAILNKEMRRLTISEWRLHMRFHGEYCPVMVTIYPQCRLEFTSEKPTFRGKHVQ
jgi:hypothetical protein